MMEPANKKWRTSNVLPFVRNKLEPRFLFTVISLTNTRVSTPVHYGDTIWLRLSPGVGGSSWSDGSVLGTSLSGNGRGRGGGGGRLG